MLIQISKFLYLTLTSSILGKMKDKSRSIYISYDSFCCKISYCQDLLYFNKFKHQWFVLVFHYPKKQRKESPQINKITHIWLFDQDHIPLAVNNNNNNANNNANANNANANANYNNNKIW